MASDHEVGICALVATGLPEGVQYRTGMEMQCMQSERSASLLEEPDEDTGDVVRYELYLQRDQGTPVRIDGDFTAWVYVTPDNRYVFTEPLYALDVREWKQYRLFDVLGIQNYTSIEAISSDGRRLLVSRRDCPFDCDNQRLEYYELTLPK
jgi:hypothetical protein